jgi:hypothetical protein
VFAVVLDLHSRATPGDAPTSGCGAVPNVFRGLPEGLKRQAIRHGLSCLPDSERAPEAKTHLSRGDANILPLGKTQRLASIIVQR